MGLTRVSLQIRKEKLEKKNQQTIKDHLAFPHYESHFLWSLELVSANCIVLSKEKTEQKLAEVCFSGHVFRVKATWQQQSQMVDPLTTLTGGKH